jgi:hypothetical protein
MRVILKKVFFKVNWVVTCKEIFRISNNKDEGD